MKREGGREGGGCLYSTFPSLCFSSLKRCVNNHLRSRGRRRRRRGTVISLLNLSQVQLAKLMVISRQIYPLPSLNLIPNLQHFLLGPTLALQSMLRIFVAPVQALGNCYGKTRVFTDKLSLPCLLGTHSQPEIPSQTRARQQFKYQTAQPYTQVYGRSLGSLVLSNENWL